MNVHGTWVLTVSGPYGRTHVVVEVQAGADGLAGVATVAAERVPLADLELRGDRLSWTQPATGPLPAVLAVGLRVRGDLATGQAVAADVPPVTVIGMRSSTAQN